MSEAGVPTVSGGGGYDPVVAKLEGQQRASTPLGELSDMTLSKKTDHWHRLSPLLESIKKAKEMFDAFEHTVQNPEEAEQFMFDRFMEMMALSDSAKSLPSPKVMRATIPSDSTTEVEEIQDAIKSLTAVQEKIKKIYEQLHQEGGEGQFTSHLYKFQKYLEASCPPNRAFLPLPQEMELLTLALTGATPLSDQQKDVIRTVLERAIGNHNLNKFLRDKNPSTLTVAESFLLEFTYTTMRDPSCLVQIHRLQKTLEGVHAKEFVELVVKQRAEEERMLNELQVTIERYKKKGRKLPLPMEQLEELLSQLQLSDDRVRSDLLLDPERREAWMKTKQLLDEVATTSRYHAQRQAAARMSVRIQKLLRDKETIEDKTLRYESGLRAGTIRPDFSLHDYWSLNRYSRLIPQKLQEYARIFENPPLAALLEQSVNARKQKFLFLSLLDALPNYSTGDILFTDDTRDKIAEGKKPITTKEEAIQAFEQVLALTGDQDEAIWPLRALGSAGLSHVSFVFVRRQEPYLFEIIAHCEENEVTLSDARDIPLRPSFVRLLTPQAKKAYQQKYGDISDQQIEKRLGTLYRRCQKEYFAAQQEVFKAYDNSSALHALKDFISKPLSEMPEGSLMRELYEWAKEKFPQLQGQRVSGQTEVEPESARLCSELVAEVIRDIQARMERYLQQELQVTFPVLRDVLPSDKPVSSYTLDTLAIDLQQSGVYSVVPEPLALRLCVSLPPRLPIFQRTASLTPSPFPSALSPTPSPFPSAPASMAEPEVQQAMPLLSSLTPALEMEGVTSGPPAPSAPTPQPTSVPNEAEESKKRPVPVEDAQAGEGELPRQRRRRVDDASLAT